MLFTEIRVRGLQIAQRSELAQIFKGIMVVGGYQSGSLPRRKLAGMQVKDSQNVLTAISGHVGVSVGNRLTHSSKLFSEYASQTRVNQEKFR